MNAIREIQGIGCVEFRVHIDGSMDWDAIAKSVVEKHVSWNRNTQGTSDVSAALLADNFRHWGSGSVRGTFLTQWNRAGADFVVRTYWDQ